MAKITVYTAARMAAIEAASIVAGVINGSGHLILSRNDGSTLDAGAVLGTVPSASPSVSGTVVLASNADVTTGTDTTKAVTPAGLVSRAASATQTGLVQLATTAEVATGTGTTKAVTPAGLASRLATSVLSGLVRLATTAEVGTGTATDIAVTPAGLVSMIAPAPTVAFSATTNSLTSAAGVYAVPPAAVSITVANPRSDRSLVCQVTWGVWMRSDTAELRASLRATGSVTWTEGSTGTGGANGPSTYSENVLIHGPIGAQFLDHSTSFTMVIPPSGSVTLAMYGYRSLTTGTQNFNYPNIRVNPLRYV
jgi:hypothetical protein